MAAARRRIAGEGRRINLAHDGGGSGRRPWRGHIHRANHVTGGGDGTETVEP
jgi:hypothetical protein